MTLGTTTGIVASRLSLITLLGALLLSLVACQDLLAGFGLGTKLEFNGGDLYYTKNADEASAKRLGEYLVKESFFDGTPKTAQLDKQGATWTLRVVVKPGMDKDERYIDVVKLFGMEVSNGVFSGEPISVELCDERMKTLRTVAPLDGKLLEFNGGQLYYASTADKKTAEELGQHLVGSKFFDGKEKTTQLIKEGDTWVFRVVVHKGVHEREEVQREFAVLGLELSAEVFDGGKVAIHLCDDTLVTLEKVECLQGKRQVFNGGDLFYGPGVSDAQAKKLGDYLVEDGFFDGAPKTVRLAKKGETWQFHMVVKEGMDQNAEFLEVAKVVVVQLTDRVFDGAKVELHLCDATLQTKRVVTK